MQAMDQALAQMIERVRAAAADHTPLRIRGGGSKDFHGRALHGEVLDTRVLSGITSYEPSELVVTARAGTPLAELEAALAERFAERPAADWEAELGALDVACVAVAREPVEDIVWLEGGMGEAMDIVTPATHPVAGDYLRLKPLVRFSRSGGVAGPAPLVGEHTDKILAELGQDDDSIADLRANGVLG